MRFLILCLLLLPQIWSQPSDPAQAARRWRAAHEEAILREFIELLSIPNLARDAPAIRQNAAAVAAILQKRNVPTRLLEVPGAPPVVFGQIQTPNAARTIVFYAHYDGQPLDPKEWPPHPGTPGSATGR